MSSWLLTRMIGNSSWEMSSRDRPARESTWCSSISLPETTAEIRCIGQLVNGALSSQRVLPLVRRLQIPPPIDARWQQLSDT